MTHYSVEIAPKLPRWSDNSYIFDILGGAEASSFEVYAAVGNPAAFPEIGSGDYYDKRIFTATERYSTLYPSYFKKGLATLYTILVVGKNGDKVVGCSDFCTFYVNDGICGVIGKYLPNWPDPSGAVVAYVSSYSHPNINGTIEDLLAYERSPEFNQYDPDYLVLKNKIATGRLVATRYIIDDTVSDPNAFEVPGCKELLNIINNLPTDGWDEISGIIRTPLTDEQKSQIQSLG